MKDDLNASEKRLIAALDRIDSFIDRAADLRRAGAGHAPPAAGEAVAELAESRARNQRLSDELAALRASHSSAVAGFEARLKVLNDRLHEAEARTVDLSRANDALAAANRALFDPDPALPGEAIRRALEAEIESLRAARQAERGKLGEIIDSLDRMLGVPLGPVAEPVTPAPPEDDDDETVAGTEALADAAELSEMGDEQRG